MQPNLEALARSYLESVGNKDLARVQALLSPDVSFVGPVMSLSGPEQVLEALRRISAIHVKNDVKRVFVDGNEVCVIYDFVTDTVGSVPTIEWLTFSGGLIQAVNLYYDQLPWQIVRQKLAARSATATA